MKKAAIVLFILLLSISVYAQTVDKAALIIDKRTDYVNPVPGETFCVTRTVNTGTTLIPKWSGDLTLVSIDKVSYQTETYSVDVPKSSQCFYTEQYLDDKIIDEKACNEIANCLYDTKNASCYCSRETPYECTIYTKEQRTRQKAVYTPIQTAESKDSTYTAFESKLTTELKELPYDSKAVTDTAATIRFCFKAPPLTSQQRSGEISYIAYTGTQYDTCESTWWNTSYCDALGGEISAQNISGVIYCVHNFSVSGTFNITTNHVVDYLIVAGGGGGGADIATGAGAGGGGAGGLNFSTNVTLTPNTYTVIVGTGGAGGTGRGFTNPQNGTASSFNGVTMTGGGAGAIPILRASAGGSGGGGSASFGAETGALGVAGQGNDGGNGASSSAAGGGGASTKGADTLAGDIGGDGGNGTLIPITNVSLYYAGGGGGGSYAKSGGLGGLGGGGNASPSGTDKAFDGINGTGGGGGGGSASGVGYGNGGNGGNGIVVIRYIITESIPQTLYVTLDTPLNNSAGSENNTFNYTTIGTNATYNCSIYFNGTLNQTAQTGNNTLSTFNLTGLGVGEWLWNITCWIDSTTYNTSETWNYTVVLITTTTTTTTTSSTTTTQAGATTNSTLYIYAIMIPIMAFIMTLSIIVKSDQPLIIVFKPFLASILWFACSGMTTSIRFIDDFTTTLSPYYIDRGNVEVGYLFTFLGGVMAFYTITVVMIIIYEFIDNKKEK